MLSQLREDDGTDIVPQVRLVLEVAISVEEKILGELGPVLAELPVDWVVSKGGEKLGDLVEEVVLVGL